MTGLQRCETSWGARRGECAVWLNGDTVCDRMLGHYPAEPHRGHDPSGSGRWIEYVERDGQAVEVARSQEGTGG